MSFVSYAQFFYRYAQREMQYGCGFYADIHSYVHYQRRINSGCLLPSRSVHTGGITRLLCTGFLTSPVSPQICFQ